MKLLSNAQLVRPLTRDVLAATISRISTLPSEVALKVDPAVKTEKHRV